MRKHLQLMAIGCVLLWGGTAYALPAGTLTFLDPVGTVGPNDVIEVWVRLTLNTDSEPFHLDSTLEGFGVNPAEIPEGWTSLTEAYTNTTFSCSGNFGSECSHGTPYTFNFNTSGPNSFNFLQDITINPGESRDYLFGTFTLSAGPVAEGTYTFYNAAFELQLSGINADGNPAGWYYSLAETCPSNDLACAFTRTVDLNCVDADGDGYSNCVECDDGNENIHPGVDTDGDGYSICDECDDNNPNIHPGAEEVCDGIDNNCDGNVDEDFDADGYSSCTGDCNDTDAAVHPDTAEIPLNSKDDDCNGDTHDQPVQWADNGHYYLRVEVPPNGITWDEAKAAAEALTYSNAPGHLVIVSSAAENLFLTNHPELGNGDGADWLDSHWMGGYQPPGSSEPDGGWQWLTTEAFSYANWHTEEPNDFGDENSIQFSHGFTADGKEWNDVHGAVLSPGYVVEFEPCAPGADLDGDGYDVVCGGDCDDTNALVNPGVAERLSNHLDDNCNGQVDENPTCTVPDANLKTAIEAELGVTDPTPNDLLNLTYLYAADSGIIDLTGLECAVNLTELFLYNNQINYVPHLSGLTELQFLYLDNNSIHDISALSGLTNIIELSLYNNLIGDISPLSELTTLAYLELSANPLNADAYCTHIPAIEANNPGLTFYYDPNPYSYYIDADGDGYGDPGVAVQAACSPAGYVSDNTDCNDAVAAIHPNTPELCDGADNNCDGNVDEDFDGDGYSACNGDCNDTDAAVHPGAAEIPLNGKDDDCNAEYTHDQPTPWADNGHYYLRVDVPDGINWADAKVAARGLTYANAHGHLVVVSSAAENLFLSNHPELGDGGGADWLDSHWMGGYQPSSSSEPDGGWQWLTPEAFAYNNWHPGEPNDWGDENSIQFSHGFTADGKEWNDVHGAVLSPGYVVEFEPCTPGADLDGDGYDVSCDGDCDDTNASVNPGVAERLSNHLDDNCNGQVDENPLCSIPDATLKAAIETELNLTDPTPAQLLGLTGLDASYTGAIADLTGLECATNLSSLHVAGNQISNLAPLTGLAKLLVLDLGANQISDISPLEGLGHLVWLFLYENQINNIAPLAGLTTLNYLWLNDNQISDLSPLSNLTNLAELYLNSNQISDLAPLSDLTKLTYLYLQYNQITDISALSAMTKLTQLYLFDNQVIDISALSAMVEMRELALHNNKQFDGNGGFTGGIVDVTPLSGLTKLTYLQLGFNQISDITPLAGLTLLQTLTLHNNQISNTTPLSGLAGLTWLYLYGNQISDIAPLAGLTNLENLALGDNPLGDISTLSTLTNLTSLQLSYCQVNNITPLAGLTKLTWLNVSDNQISNIAPLAGLTHLNSLFLHYNPISDITPLTGFTTLKELFLDNAPLNRTAYCTHLPAIETNNPGIYLRYDPNPSYDCSVVCTDSDNDSYFAEEGCGTPIDCDDTDPDQFPGQVWYKDLDHDGTSDGQTITTCLSPNGYAAPSDLQALSGDTDDDGDGMDDSWEIMHGLDPLLDDALADNDLDGFCNRREFQGGTSPSDPEALPSLSVDSDTDVDGVDLAALARAFGPDCTTSAEGCFFDFDGNGSVDQDDVSLFLQTYGH